MTYDPQEFARRHAELARHGVQDPEIRESRMPDLIASKPTPKTKNTSGLPYPLGEQAKPGEPTNGGI